MEILPHCTSMMALLGQVDSMATGSVSKQSVKQGWGVEQEVVGTIQNGPSLETDLCVCVCVCVCECDECVCANVCVVYTGVCMCECE